MTPSRLAGIGFALVLCIAVALPATAYHSPPNGDGTALPQQQSPGYGQITLCEDYTNGQPGIGGLCFMSTDKADLDGSAGGNPEDWGTTTNEDVKDNNIWSCVMEGTGADGFYRVGSNDHGLFVAAGGTFHYKELLAIWIDDGHATFFAHTGSGNPGLSAPYSADFDCTVPADVTCNGPAGTAAYKMDTVCTDLQGPADPLTWTIEGAFGLLDCILNAIDAYLAGPIPGGEAALVADLVECAGPPNPQEPPLCMSFFSYTPGAPFVNPQSTCPPATCTWSKIPPGAPAPPMEVVVYCDSTQACDGRLVQTDAVLIKSNPGDWVESRVYCGGDQEANVVTGTTATPADPVKQSPKRQKFQEASDYTCRIVYNLAANLPYKASAKCYDAVL